MKKYIISIIFLLSFVALLSCVSAQTNVSGCMNLTTPGETYVMNKSINSTSWTDHCLWAQADNIVLNMNGYNITGENIDGTSFSPIYLADAAVTTPISNFTVKNGKLGNVEELITVESFSGTVFIENMSSFLDIGAVVSGAGAIAEFSIFVNNSQFILAPSGGTAFYNTGALFSNLDNTKDLTIANSIFNSRSKEEAPESAWINFANIVFATTPTVTITNSVINSSGDILGITTPFVNVTITDTILQTGPSSNGKCIFETDGYGGLLAYMTNVTYIDCTEDLSGGLTAGDSDYLYRRWHYRAYVNDTAGNSVSSANVSAFTWWGSFEFNLTTNASGWTPIAPIVEYVNFNTEVDYYSNYTIYASNATASGSKSLNITTSHNILNHVITITSAPADTTPPAVSIVYPLNTSYSINVSALNYTSSEAGFCWYSRNAGVANSTSVAAGTNFTSVTSVEGSNVWRVYCNDTAGNTNFTSLTFFKDSIAPSVTVDSPTSGYSTTDTQVNFTITVSDVTSSISSRWYSIDGSSNVTFSGSDLVTQTSYGSHSVVFCANDTLNNIACASAVAYTVNVPTVANTGGNTGYTATGQAITLNDIIVTSDINWSTNKYYTVKIKGVDINGSLVKLDYVSAVKSNDSTNEIIIGPNGLKRLADGSYEIEFYVRRPINSTTQSFDIYGRQANKEVTKRLTVTMTDTSNGITDLGDRFTAWYVEQKQKGELIYFQAIIFFCFLAVVIFIIVMYKTWPKKERRN